jgi:hypothetical protein
MIRKPEDLPQKALFRPKWKEKSRKTEIQVGGWVEQRLDALFSRQADMKRSSLTGLNQVLVVVPHK